MVEINSTLNRAQIDSTLANAASDPLARMMDPTRSAKIDSIKQQLDAIYSDGKISDQEGGKLAYLAGQLTDLAKQEGRMPVPFGRGSNLFERSNTLLSSLSESIAKDLKELGTATAAAIKSSNAAGSSVEFLQSMDIATALMFVQTERVNRLEEQIKDQLATVSKRNEQVGKLNSVLTEANALSSATGTNAGDKLSKDANLTLLNAAAAKAGYKIDPAVVPGETTKADLEKVVSNIKNAVDGLTNTQQMDMLRLQSLNNKRNEAFEIMTNVMKKVSDLLSNIASKLG